MGRRQCQHEGCCKQAQASLEGVSKYCFTHMTCYGMSPKTHICEHDGCYKQVATSSCGIRKYCRGHMKEYGLQPREHQCQHEGCEKRVQTSEEGSRLYCIQHMRHYGLNPRQHTCKHAGCQSRACYSTDGQRLYCGTHMRQNGLKPQRRLCIQDGCVKQAQCSKTGEYNYCYAHMKLYGLKPYRGKGQMQRPPKKLKLTPVTLTNPPALSDTSENTNMLHGMSPGTCEQTQSPTVSSVPSLNLSARPHLPDNHPSSLNVAPNLLSPESESRARALRHAVAASGRFEHPPRLLPPVSSTMNKAPRPTNYPRESYPAERTPLRQYQTTAFNGPGAAPYEYHYPDPFDNTPQDDLFGNTGSILKQEPARSHGQTPVSYPMEQSGIQRKLVMLPSTRNPTQSVVKSEPYDMSMDDIYGSGSQAGGTSSNAPSNCSDPMPQMDWLDDWPVLGSASTEANLSSSTAPGLRPPSANLGSIPAAGRNPVATSSSASTAQAHTPSQDLSSTPLKDSSLSHLFELGCSSVTAPQKLSQIANSIFGTPGRTALTPNSSSSPLSNTDWLLGSPLLADHLLDPSLLSFTPPMMKSSPTPTSGDQPPVARQLPTGPEIGTVKCEKAPGSALPVLDKSFNLDAHLSMLDDDLDHTSVGACAPHNIDFDALLNPENEQLTSQAPLQGTGQSNAPALNHPHTSVSSLSSSQIPPEMYSGMEWPHHGQASQPQYPSGIQVKTEDCTPAHSHSLEQPNSCGQVQTRYWQQPPNIKSDTSACVGFDAEGFLDDWASMGDVAQIAHNASCAGIDAPLDNLSQTMPHLPSSVQGKPESLNNANHMHHPPAGYLPYQSIDRHSVVRDLPRATSTASSTAWAGTKMPYHQEPRGFDSYSMSNAMDQRPSSQVHYTNTRDYPRSIHPAAAQNRAPPPRSNHQYNNGMVSQRTNENYTMNPVSQHTNENYTMKPVTFTSSARAPVSQLYSRKCEMDMASKEPSAPYGTDSKWGGNVSGSARSRSSKNLDEQSAALRDACALREAALNAGGGRKAPAGNWAMAAYM